MKYLEKYIKLTMKSPIIGV